MKATVIITIYKNYKALELILNALQSQSMQCFEVIVAEDNNDTAFAQWLRAQQYIFPVQHVSQPDDGFRKCAILNKAVAAAKAPYIIFLDGDCVPHRHFVKGHMQSKLAGHALFGRRVMLSEKLTQKVYHKPSMLHHPMRLLLFFWYKCERIDAAIYFPAAKPKPKVSIWGCNWSIAKQEIIDVGGFDEQYTQPGIGEDVDITHRLLRRGIKILQIKMRAVQYHLWHPLNYTSTADVEAILDKKMKVWAEEDAKK